MEKVRFVRKVSKQGHQFVITVPPDVKKILKHRGVYQVELTPTLCHHNLLVAMNQSHD